MSVNKIILATAIAGLFTASASAQELIVKIGHVAPTTGSIAHLGKDNENGFKMAIDDLNAKGVTIGGELRTYRLALAANGEYSEFQDPPTRPRSVQQNRLPC